MEKESAVAAAAFAAADVPKLAAEDVADGDADPSPVDVDSTADNRNTSAGDDFGDVVEDLKLEPSEMSRLKYLEAKLKRYEADKENASQMQIDLLSVQNQLQHAEKRREDTELKHRDEIDLIQKQVSEKVAAIVAAEERLAAFELDAKKAAEYQAKMEELRVQNQLQLAEKYRQDTELKHRGEVDIIQKQVSEKDAAIAAAEERLQKQVSEKDAAIAAAEERLAASELNAKKAAEYQAKMEELQKINSKLEVEVTARNLRINGAKEDDKGGKEINYIHVAATGMAATVAIGAVVVGLHYLLHARSR